MEGVFHSVLANIFGKSKLTPVHFEGILIPTNDNDNTSGAISDDHKKKKKNTEKDPKSMFNDIHNIVVKVLCDTGALCANYVSNNLIQDIRTRLLKSDFKKQRTRITLADDSKQIESQENVNLTIDILGSDGSMHSYTGEFVCINMRDNDLIIGLPAILGELWDFFKDHVELARSQLKTSPQQLLFSDQVSTADINQLVDPWQISFPDEAPEEAAVPLPAQFEFASSFLGKSREEALSEYFAMFDEHINPSFRSQTDVEKLLKTKGLDVFIPANWEGIKGIEPLNLEFKDTFPERMKPKARPVNPRLWEAAEKEFNRLKGYFYEPSRSPWASCLVIAPKATKPFIRFCGDYSSLNNFIPTGHYNIPTIRHELDKIIGYSIYLDIDLTNAFHQIPLHPDLAARLSIQTPWGQYQPRFMPEGIGPGSAVLQETVRQLFGEFDWAIVIFDNILILATDYQDAYSKLEIFLDKCLKHNVILKFAKSWLGFTKVHFFGYDCTHKSMELTEDRKKALMDIPFPVDGNRCKKIRSLLGVGVMFAPFVPHYSNLVANLTDMTKASFDWSESTWKHPYREQFEAFKLGLQKACALYYPDYSLDWILRTDASDYGIGSVLLQVFISSTGEKTFQPIAFYSKKFSEQAAKWPTIEKEGYAIYLAVKKFAYYLVGKDFVIQTDHNNLRWMEASEVPKIVRWRIYLQSFSFLIEHISGVANTVADALSRLLLLSHFIDTDGCAIPEDQVDNFLFCILGDAYEDDVDATLAAVFSSGDTLSSEVVVDSHTNASSDLTMSFEEIFQAVHNAKDGHWGLRETWKRLNKHYPGHGASMKEVSELVATCSTCQKTRKERRDKLVPVVRTLKPPHSRSAIGVDALAITPHGAKGETHIILVVNLFTKFVHLTPSHGCSAHNLAVSIWLYWCNFGCTDMIVSDRGPDLTSQLFKELVSLVHMTHVFSIADRHVNGSERLIKEAQRHLRAVVYDSRVKDVFDDLTIIPSVQHIINSKVSAETGYTPYELTYGSVDKLYTHLLSDATATEQAHVFLQRLNENVSKLRKASAAFQDSLVQDRLRPNPVHPNRYQPGDYVTYDSGPKPRPKMSCRYKGPYMVEQQYRNDVTCRNLITDACTQFSLTDLEPFFAKNPSDAYDAALRDQDQFVVLAILGYCGDSRSRSQMTFRVQFADGDIVSLPWSKDLECAAYFDYCQAHPHLYHLTLDATLAKKYQTQLRKEPITCVAPGDSVFVDLRFFGDGWYEALSLPDAMSTSYVFLFTYTHWHNKTNTKKITGHMDIDHSYHYALDGYAVFCWGACSVFDPSHMVLVDHTLVKAYPAIMA